MSRPASPDSGSILYGTSLEHRMWQHAQQQRAEHRLSALFGMQTMTIIAATLLTCGLLSSIVAIISQTYPSAPSKHVEVAPHGHHAVTPSTARRGARIELLPLLLRRREPEELNGIIWTVQHAHTLVSLKFDDATVLGW
jgi:hypothetical protein